MSNGFTIFIYSRVNKELDKFVSELCSTLRTATNKEIEHLDLRLIDLRQNYTEYSIPHDKLSQNYRQKLREVRFISSIFSADDVITVVSSNELAPNFAAKMRNNGHKALSLEYHIHLRCLIEANPNQIESILTGEYRDIVGVTQSYTEPHEADLKLSSHILANDNIQHTLHALEFLQYI